MAWGWGIGRPSLVNRFVLVVDGRTGEKTRMVDEVRGVCEEMGGAHAWLDDEIGMMEAFEWDGPAGQLQVTLDPVHGVGFVAHEEEGEVWVEEVEGVDHLRRLIAWVSEGGPLPES